MARKTPEINSSSMADIAFLLLIFFLVSTIMDVDTGIYKKLPLFRKRSSRSWCQGEKRNVFAILVNRNNELLVNGELIDISQLREKTKVYLESNNDENLPEKKLVTVPFFRCDGFKRISIVTEWPWN